MALMNRKQIRALTLAGQIGRLQAQAREQKKRPMEVKAHAMGDFTVYYAKRAGRWEFLLKRAFGIRGRNLPLSWDGDLVKFVTLSALSYRLRKARERRMRAAFQQFNAHA